MRVLVVTAAFVPSNFGGTKQVAYSVARALSNVGHKVCVFTTDADVGNSRLKNINHRTKMDGFDVWYFKNINNYIASKFRLFLPLGMRSALKQDIGQFDVAHLHDYRSIYNIFTHHYAIKQGVPYIVDAHGSTPRYSGGKKGIKWPVRGLFDIAFGNRILRDAAKVVAETELGIDEYIKLGVDESKIALMPPPFPIEDFSRLPLRGRFRQRYDIKERYVILFLGRLHHIKGIDFLVESFSELARNRNDVLLVLVGPDDGYKPSLEKLVAKLNISDRVLFTGFLDGDDKLSAYVDADVLVQTSRYEQGAWVPFEAVLCNTPIIVSSNSGAGEDVKRIDAGYLVEYGNRDDLKNKMDFVLNNHDEAAAKTGNAAEYIRSNLSLSQNVVKYEQIYAQCIEGQTKERTENKHPETHL